MNNIDQIIDTMDEIRTTITLSAYKTDEFLRHERNLLHALDEYAGIPESRVRVAVIGFLWSVVQRKIAERSPARSRRTDADLVSWSQRVLYARDCEQDCVDDLLAIVEGVEEARA